MLGSLLSFAALAAHCPRARATVKTHIGHIMAKLGLRDRIQIVVYAYETGLVTPQGRPGKDYEAMRGVLPENTLF